MIAVVIPVFNAAKWIEETIRSVHAQTIDPKLVEIIIVDDNSTDGSTEVAEKALKGGPHRYRLMKSGYASASRSRNIGWESTKAQWIQFLDADDLLHPEKLALQFDAARKAHEAVAVYYSDWQKYTLEAGEWKKSGPVLKPRLEPDPETRILRADAFVQIGAALFNRSWLSMVHGFDNDCKPIEDVNLLLRLAFAGAQFKHLPYPEPVLLYRQVPNSFSRQNAVIFAECSLANAELAEARWRENQKMFDERRRLLAEIYFYNAQFFAGRDWNRFRQLEAKLNSLYPSFVPWQAGPLRMLSQLIGYGRAEHIAAVYRRLRSTLVGKPR